MPSGGGGARPAEARTLAVLLALDPVADVPVPVHVRQRPLPLGGGRGGVGGGRGTIISSAGSGDRYKSVFFFQPNAFVRQILL